MNVFEHHISILRVICEVSCETEDWSNDVKNSALITGINYRKQLFKLS